MNKIKALTLIAVLCFLASCTPFQDAASAAVNETTGDQAQLEPRLNSLVFFPLGEVTDVLVDIQGDGLESLDDADNCTGDASHLQCALGVASEPVTIELYGSSLSAVVSYKRDGVWLLEVLVVPG